MVGHQAIEDIVAVDPLIGKVGVFVGTCDAGLPIWRCALNIVGKERSGRGGCGPVAV